MKSWLKVILWYGLVTAATAGAAWLLYARGHLVAATLVVVVPPAMIVNGWLAEAEDRRPGGFLNPAPPHNHTGSTDENDG